MIYEYISMIDDDLAAVSYQYTHLAHADVKNFYPSIYTHSIAWAIHGKRFIRRNMHDYTLIGNRLDKLFQNANDGCTNGLPIGPVVSDIVAELILSAVDTLLSTEVKKRNISCKIVRFKDDYRILAKSESEAKSLVKILQDSLKQYNLELNEHKTEISTLPDKLFREWVSKYHAVRPPRWKSLGWQEFRELYLSVIRIDKECPNTGVIDRFLADIVDKKGQLRLRLGVHNLQRVTSMLLMLATLRLKAFPKIIAILEANMHRAGEGHFEPLLLEYLEEYLHKLANEETRNKYLLAWICYFLSSNNLSSKLKTKPNLKDPVVRSILNNRSTVFTASKEFILFEGCVSTRKRVSMFEHLDIFNPPEDIDD